MLEIHLQQAAQLAPDGIPQQYGDLASEYQAALTSVVLMDRSHEGRLSLGGADRFAFLQRISTNDLLGMKADEGRPTIFTNPQGRILDRVMAYNRQDDLLLETEPGRAAPLLHALQRQIFFRDQVSITDLTPSSHHFALHGPQADRLVDSLVSATKLPDGLWGMSATISGVTVYMTRRKPLSTSQYSLIVPRTDAPVIWNTLCSVGQSYGLHLAGSLTYNTLRIRAGRPGVGRELSTDYIPLEAGLWDEISFTKGCYTGQEIIARMESRQRLAKVMVKCRLSGWQEAPDALKVDDKLAGTLTSAVHAPDGDIFGIAFVKLPFAVKDQVLQAGEARVTVTDFAGVPPPLLQ